MAEELLGPRSRSTAAGSTSSSPTTRTRSPSRARSAIAFAEIWAHNGLLQFTGDKMSKSVGNIATIREVLDRWGRETAARLLPRRPLAQADRLLRRDDGAGGGAGRRASARSSAAHRVPADRAAWERFAAALDDDFNTPGGARRHARWRRSRAAAPQALDVFGLELRSPRRRRAAGDRRARRAARRGARAARDFESADRLRAEIEAGGLGDARRAGRLHARPQAVSADLVYGRRAVREALRGRREVLELLRPSGRSPSEPWLAEAKPEASARSRADASSPARATIRASSRGSSRSATPMPTSSPPSREPLLAVLDQVTDPHNLGAVCRSAEGAGATGVVVPAHGSAVVTPAVARASAGAIEHLPIAVVTNLARYLDEVKGAVALGLRRGRARRESDDVGHRPRRAASRSSSAPRARGSARSCAGAATRSSRSRSPARSSR